MILPPPGFGAWRFLSSHLSPASFRCCGWSACGDENRGRSPPPHRPRHQASDAILYAFDLLEINGEDLRSLPLSKRKDRLQRLLLSRKTAGIALNEHIYADGAAVFRHACKLGLEGIVSKRLTASYRSGPSRDWLKVKNPASPAMRRARAGLW
jgi:bifunctional non-homologous end joining protein LigD